MVECRYGKYGALENLAGCIGFLIIDIVKFRVITPLDHGD